MPGEFAFIHWLRQQQTASSAVPVPAGDDLAVLRWTDADLLLVGVDQVLDGVHFDSTVHSPGDIGRKVMNRNLSDCAAMACLPAGAVVSVALPQGCGDEYAKELYLGIKAAGEVFDCPIVGGDTGSWAGKLAVTVTILGRSAGIAPVTRKGAKVGDGLYVSGPLGGSILGRHMTFTPRVELARKLATGEDIHAMIDLSDGLSRDAGHIAAESGVGLVIEAATVPVHDDARTLSQRDGVAPIDHALHDGEDHELLAVLPPEAEAMALDLGMIRIGKVIEGQGVWLDHGGQRTAMPVRGWEHRL
ncbi:thiamine-phosphate kinase [Humisphaera borealis]|uniref:Thiamine-monophosphate kinase n=1 Tax=Humisphaera borealis TaxID=2807512 RepID=A0A7M2WUT0_9BACT|nr:thiamine-phosphate kinase [Humisphaera borealis]QOV88942.1 thiamine-monophosphate kinase [Humisphaera borealis]